MPESDEQEITAAPAETERERFERERLSRRQALKRLGMTSAMATFAMFSVDDLARMVGKAMQQRAGDNKVAGQIAQEFQKAGAVMAWGASGSNCFANGAHYNCTGCGGGYSVGICCSHATAKNACCGASFGTGGTGPDPNRLMSCCQMAWGSSSSDDYQVCVALGV